MADDSQFFELNAAQVSEEYSEDYDEDEEYDEESSISSSRVSSLSGDQQHTENYGEWLNMPEMVNARFRFAGSASLDGRLYVFGGIGSHHRRMKDIEFYSPEQETWIDTVPPMESACTGSSCTTVGDDIFIFGGKSGDSRTATKSWQKFSTLTKSSNTTKPEMESSQEQHVSILLGKNIYIFAGFRKQKGLVFDRENEEWSLMCGMNVVRYLCAAVAAGGKIYCVGGMKELKRGNKRKGDKNLQYGRYLETMEVFDPSFNKWTLSSATMNNRRAGCSVVTDGKTITVVGGRDEHGDVLAIEEFDIQTNRWQPSSSYCKLSSGRSEFSAMLASNNDLVIIGGVRGYSVPNEQRVLNSVMRCKKVSCARLREEVREGNKNSNLQKICKTSITRPAACSNKEKQKPLKGGKREVGSSTSIVEKPDSKKPAKRKKQENITNNRASLKSCLSQNLLSNERLHSFERTKQFKTQRIIDCEKDLFGEAQSGPLYQRMCHLEEVVGRAQENQFDSLSNERFDLLEKMIQSRRQTLDQYESEIYGKVTKGPLDRRMKNLEESF